MKKIIIGNWKLNLDHLEAIQLLQKLNYSLEVDIEDNIDIVLAPSHTSLRSLQTIVDADKLKIKISSQDVMPDSIKLVEAWSIDSLFWKA